MNINDILNMLDWNNPKEIQQEGRLQASKIKCLNVFMQPMDKQYNKNIWENCALIISEKEDSLLTPYLFDLLDWLQDLNWPGAIIILERLQRYHNYDSLNMAIKDRIIVANALEDGVWLSNLSELLMRDEMKNQLDAQIYDIVKEYIE